MGTISDKLTYLSDTKAAIKNAITAKGVTVSDDDTFRSYADKINAISGGGGFTGFADNSAIPFYRYICKCINANQRYIAVVDTANNEIEKLVSLSNIKSCARSVKFKSGATTFYTDELSLFMSGNGYTVISFPYVNLSKQESYSDSGLHQGSTEHLIAVTDCTAFDGGITDKMMFNPYSFVDWPEKVENIPFKRLYTVSSALTPYFMLRWRTYDKTSGIHSQLEGFFSNTEPILGTDGKVRFNWSPRVSLDMTNTWTAKKTLTFENSFTSVKWSIDYSLAEDFPLRTCDILDTNGQIVLPRNIDISDIITTA